MAELKKLGRYELRSVLGKGAMGVVYEGFDPTLSRRVAVKTILKSVALDDETERSYAERFVREAKAVARLNHPNIIQVFDFGVENDVAYLVMEFIQGRELRAFFSTGEAFEAGECIRIMGELLDALDFAHEAGVVHRDVKPANVMLDGQRRVKLADFGVARIQDSDRSAAGTMVGTPAFMSPEQISGGKVDRRTDIFSAGTILYQLLTGEQPFKGEGAWTVAKQIMQDEPAAPSSVVKSVTPAFDAIVNKALAKNPAQRFASAREFAGALRGALGAGAQAASSLPPKPKAKPEARASEAEVEFWRSIQNSTDAAEIEFYLEQFPEGTYSQLARHKIAKLKEPVEAARKAALEKERLEAEARAKREAEEKARYEAAEKAKREAEETARREAEEKARREAKEKARREAEEKARREAEEKARREAEEKARREAAEKAKREASERARRETEEKVRQAQALARLKQQEQAAVRAKAAVDVDATVAIGGKAAAPLPPAERRPSYAMPVIATVVLAAGGIGAYFALGRRPAPAPVAQAPAPAPAPAAPPKAEVSAADIEKIKKEAEERIRREYAEKSAAEQAAMVKAASEKAAQEKLLALRAAAAEKAAAAKVAQEKAAAERALAAKAAAETRAAAEKAAAERAASQKAAEEKAAEERAAAEKAAAEKARVEKAAAEKAAEKARVAAQSPYHGFWRGEQGIWRVLISVTGSEVHGSFACYRRGSWSGNVPIRGRIGPDGLVQAQMAVRSEGWQPREVLGRLPKVEVSLVHYAQRVDCPDGSVTLKKE